MSIVDDHHPDPVSAEDILTYSPSENIQTSVNVRKHPMTTGLAGLSHFTTIQGNGNVSLRLQRGAEVRVKFQ